MGRHGVPGVLDLVPVIVLAALAGGSSGAARADGRVPNSVSAMAAAPSSTLPTAPIGTGAPAAVPSPAPAPAGAVTTATGAPSSNAAGGHRWFEDGTKRAGPAGAAPNPGFPKPHPKSTPPEPP